MPPVMLFICSSEAVSTWRIASFTADMIRSCSISTSSGSTASGEIVSDVISFLPETEVRERLNALQVPFEDLKCECVNLEDAFIGLTGKY